MNSYTLYDYWWVLYKRKYVILLTAAWSVAFAAVLSLMLPDIYEAKAVFFVPSKPDALTFFSGAGSTQVTRAPLVPDTRAGVQKTYLGILESDGMRAKAHEAFPQRTLRELRRHVDFKTGDNFMLRVYVRDRDPALAARIANHYVENFNQMVNAYSLKSTVENRTALKQLLGETQEKLATARAALANFQRENKVALVKEESQDLTKLKNDFVKQLDDANVKAQEVTSKLQAVQEQFSRESNVYVSSKIAATSSLVQTLEKQLSDLESQIAGARVNLTENHPEVQALRAQYLQKKKDLNEEMNRIVKSEVKVQNTFLENLRQEMVNLYVERELLKARKAALTRQIGEVEIRIDNLPRLQSRYEQLNWDISQYQKLVENLHVGLEEAAAQEHRALHSIVVVDEATVPDKPIFPDMVLNILVALGLGLVGGIFYALLIDYFDRVKLQLEREVKEIEKEYVLESMRS